MYLFPWLEMVLCLVDRRWSGIFAAKHQKEKWLILLEQEIPWWRVLYMVTCRIIITQNAFRYGICTGSASAFSEELATKAEVEALIEKNKKFICREGEGF